MSETKKMTKLEILEIFKDEYKSVLRKYERNVEKYALKMNEDYEYFFRWYGDDMYKAQVNLKAVRELRPTRSRHGWATTLRTLSARLLRAVSTRQAQASWLT